MEIKEKLKTNEVAAPTLFVGVGAMYQREKCNSRLTLIVLILAFFAVIVAIALFYIPYDANYANHKNLDKDWVNGILKWK